MHYFFLTFSLCCFSYTYCVFLLSSQPYLFVYSNFHFMYYFLQECTFCTVFICRSVYNTQIYIVYFYYVLTFLFAEEKRHFCIHIFCFVTLRLLSPPLYMYYAFDCVATGVFSHLFISRHKHCLAWQPARSSSNRRGSFCQLLFFSKIFITNSRSNDTSLATVKYRLFCY